MTREDMILDETIAYATAMHGEQKRKYTFEPYITHPIAVMEIVRTVPHSIEMLQAAVLHDTVEDTEATLSDITKLFGATVAELVYHLTDKSTPEDGNRAARKKIDREWNAKGDASAQTIKVADLIHNSFSIVEHGGGFAYKYLAEKDLTLVLLTKADKTLVAQAVRQITLVLDK